MMVSKNIYGIIYFLLLVHTAAPLMTFTNFKCESLDKEALNVRTCIIKPINRNVKEATVYLELRNVTVEHIEMRVQLMKKANGYKPWLLDKTINLCEFLAHPKRVPMIDFMYGFVKNYSNLNHKCPYNEDIYVKQWRLEEDKMILPMPFGEYLVHVQLKNSGKPFFLFQVFLRIELNNKYN